MYVRPVICFCDFDWYIWFIIKLIHRAADDTIECSRCDGKGYWYGAREREKCDWCKGSGRLPKQR